MIKHYITFLSILAMCWYVLWLGPLMVSSASVLPIVWVAATPIVVFLWVKALRKLYKSKPKETEQ